MVSVMEPRAARDYTKGHRERLRARYWLSGEAALQDYELLELLFTIARARRGARPLERFGGEGSRFPGQA